MGNRQQRNMRVGRSITLFHQLTDMPYLQFRLHIGFRRPLCLPAGLAKCQRLATGNLVTQLKPPCSDVLDFGHLGSNIELSSSVSNEVISRILGSRSTLLCHSISHLKQIGLGGSQSLTYQHSCPERKHRASQRFCGLFRGKHLGNYVCRDFVCYVQCASLACHKPNFVSCVAINKLPLINAEYLTEL